VSAHETVGVVGLGAMGGAIAANLVDAGFGVFGFDPDPQARERLAAAGGRTADSPGAVAEAAGIVLLSLPTEAAFVDVAIDSAGLAAGARPGTVVVEMSTLPIAVKQRGRAALAAHRVVLLDCPLSGTGDQAVHRDLVVLASGDAAAIARCVPVFAGFARAHHVLGAFGTGTKMKFIANHLVAIHNLAAAEAMTLARAAGLDLEQTLEVIADGAGTSRMFEVRGPKMAAREYGSGVRTRVFQKDLGAIDAFAADVGVPVPFLALATQFYAAAASAGHADDDTASVYEVLLAMSA